MSTAVQIVLSEFS